ncbi:Acid phosphatase 1 [Platanthera guangdongensis]|uniref:Acid phosphatase 1 n=1 Tax=Platanthera guangdongensis TaxID=2320717 RepID=A0ABR2N195_9ASPA
MLTLRILLLLMSYYFRLIDCSTNIGAETLLRILPATEKLSSDEVTDVVGDEPREAYCESWRLSVETNNAGNWKKISTRCTDLVEAYVTGPQYALDSKVVARHAQAYAKNLILAGDGKDVWIFDVDETLISNVHHYFLHGRRYSYILIFFLEIILCAAY